MEKNFSIILSFSLSKTVNVAWKNLGVLIFLKGLIKRAYFVCSENEFVHIVVTVDFFPKVNILQAFFSIV